MPRELQDEDEITWTCVQAFSGIGNSEEKKATARVEGEEDRYYVVCTPSGAATSVRIELPDNWETTLSDAELLKQIARQQSQS